MQNRLEYTDPRSTQTLREGIQALRGAEGIGNDAAENVAPELAQDIDMHDAIHVLFGCSTSLSSEIIAHVWTAFGTTTKAENMRRVNQHSDHRQVLAKIGHRRLLKAWLRSLPQIIMTIFQAMRMKRRWPAESYEEYLDLPLCDIRRSFGIRLSKTNRSGSSTAGAALRHIRA